MLTTVVVIALGTVAFTAFLNFIVVLSRRTDTEPVSIQAGRVVAAVLGILMTWFACIGAILLLTGVV